MKAFQKDLPLLRAFLPQIEIVFVNCGNSRKVLSLENGRRSRPSASGRRLNLYGGGGEKMGRHHLNCLERVRIAGQWVSGWCSHKSISSPTSFPLSPPPHSPCLVLEKEMVTSICKRDDISA